MTNPQRAVPCISISADISEATYGAVLRTIGECLDAHHHEIHFLIVSRGGTLSHGIALFNVMSALKENGIKFVTHNVGNVDSSALLPYLAGQERYAAPNAGFWFHNVTWPGLPEMTRPRAQALLERTEFEEARMAAIVADVTGMEPSSVRALFDSDAIHSASSAKELGIVTEVRPLALPDPNEIVSLAP